MEVHIITNYTCNRKCGFCYLGDLCSEAAVLNLDKLKEQLDEVTSQYSIDEIKMYGGEISLLPIEFLNHLYDICSKYTQNLSTSTNFSNTQFNTFCDLKKIKLGTSINEERDGNKFVEDQLLINDNKNISLMQVVTPSLLIMGAQKVLQNLKMYGLSVSFLQYSPSKHAKVNYNISNKEYADFLKDVITEYATGEYNFTIANINDIERSLCKRYIPDMKETLFITPLNQYSCVQYDNGLEYFKVFSNLNEWQCECDAEQDWYKSKCHTCNYYGHCYAEHIRTWNQDDECCGMKTLMRWYENEKGLYKDN